MHDRKFRGTSDYAPPVPRGTARAFSPEDLSRFFKLRAWTVALPIAIALTIAFGYVQIAVPVYTAHAQIIIDPRLPQFIPGRNEESLLAWDSAQVESEIAVLQSERIAAAVVTKIGLDKADDFRKVPTFMGRLKALLLPGQDAEQPRTDRFRDALGLIQSGLSVRRAGLSYAIDISFTFPDRVRAMEIANSVAESYITDQIENRSQAARVGGEWLQKRIILLKAQMNAAAQAVERFRAGHNYAIARPEVGVGPATGKEEDASASAIPHDDRTVDELEASAATYRRIYESFLQSYTESVQRQSFPVSDARILTPASLPQTRSAPRVLLIYALALLTGGLIGLGLALLQHHLDQTVHSASEVADASGLEELGTLPRFASGVSARLRRWGRRLLRSRPPSANRTGGVIRSQLSKNGGKRRNLAPYVFASPYDRDARYLTALRTISVLTELHHRQRPLKTIGVTAPHRGSGSSTLVGQLGTLAADGGARVLIVDADFGRRRLTDRLGPDAHAGLAEVLDRQSPLEQAVIPFTGTSLDFIGAGRKARAGDACQVKAEALERFISTVACHYDLILVDLPPVLPVGEVVAIAAVLDGMILVVECGATSAGVVAASAACLEQAKARALGFVLSKAPN